ncbi:MAG: HAD family hydrolase [Elusimicrobia bacterium]|nr:HAD family hydrolase [Elusimicrobiota bacterium]
MGRKDKKNRAVFIDRDGTIIHEKNYLRKVNEIKLLSGAVEALKILKEKKFKLILVTNQSGIARGFLTTNKLKQIHKYLESMLLRKGVKLDAVYFCPHGPDSGCDCRKPNLGMVKRAQKKFNINLKKSFTVGDHANDYLLGKNMGGKGIFILTGHGKQELKKIKKDKILIKPEKIFKNFLYAAKYMVKN